MSPLMTSGNSEWHNRDRPKGPSIKNSLLPTHAGRIFFATGLGRDQTAKSLKAF